MSHLSWGQREEAVGVKELDQGACWDLSTYPEKQCEWCMNQVHTCGLQAAGGAAQWLLWVWRVEAVGWQRLQWTNKRNVLNWRHRSHFKSWCLNEHTSVCGTDQREQQRVEVCGDAEGVHAEHLASLLQTLVNGGPQTGEQNIALPQTVDINRKCSEVLREDELRNMRLQRSAKWTQNGFHPEIWKHKDLNVKSHN